MVNRTRTLLLSGLLLVVPCALAWLRTRRAAVYWRGGCVCVCIALCMSSEHAVSVTNRALVLCSCVTSLAGRCSRRARRGFALRSIRITSPCVIHPYTHATWIDDTLSTIIPGTCSTTCATWLTSLGACPSTPDTTAATTDYNTCVCDAAFVTAFTTCSACMTTALTAATDPQLALPATALADLTAYCATVAGGTAATPAAATTATTAATTTAAASPTTTAAAASPTTNAASSVAASPTVSSSSTTPFNTTPTAVIITSVFQGQGFPTQTKSANVFTGDAQGRVQVALGALLVAAGAVWFV
ncbi:BZ3500_MvSof-1268-A1-R1_Chr8-2g10256 [Microbotryum saponariae]|uniref:BZ3500_MvSof-1268-A1-R1_Chr8-2g10256 protein n=1 Tax=Microbotryum saponariae TaxID=289078 RepID=A0A2X0KU32_9BASI|nr:BZ3500_MvSof-1268-A1-R1_Chr8-2g10256 [Microbotryum saponariae]SDA02054.1 BZ3501_MvSof-1269-A2-R1_Chr8-2g10006 [Microbotryum saponariae]